jgi:uncharacterized protein (DUF1330 family)
LQFDSAEKAKGWHNSPAYAEAKNVRDVRALYMIGIEGV